MNCNTFEITFITVTGSFEDVNTTNTNNPVKAAEALMCVQCKKNFQDSYKLKKHVGRAHAEKVHECPDCGKTFALPHKLKIHALCHTQFAEFLCALCGKRFKRRDKLRCHVQRMHSAEKESKVLSTYPKPPRSKRYRSPKLTPEEEGKFAYKCTICVTGFHRRGILVNHMARLHPEVPIQSVPQLSNPVIKPRRSFKCHYCDRAYTTNGKRKCHIISFHADANIAMTSRLLDMREVGSMEIAPRPCSLCPRQFLTNAKLLQHQRKFHPVADPAVLQC